MKYNINSATLKTALAKITNCWRITN